jgi:hypothetical protein
VGRGDMVKIATMSDLKAEGEPAKRFTVKWGTEVFYFNTPAEVRAFAKKRLDRQYEIYDRRKLVKLTDLKEEE